MNVRNRTIFGNDNLYILRGLDTESIDLICLDPPIATAITPHTSAVQLQEHVFT